MMKTGEFEVSMKGGKPWGIRMKGGKGTDAALTVAHVTEGSKAFLADVEPGLIILAINGVKVTNVAMPQAENMIKETGDQLTMRLLKQENAAEYFRDMKRNLGGPTREFGNTAVKGNTFKMLSSHIDAGQTGSVLTAWDKPVGHRNESIPTVAPKVQGSVEGSGQYDKSYFGVADDRDSRQTSYVVIMEGGRPWGFRLQGGRGTGTPLHIAQVTPESKAHTKRLLVDDEILSINGISAKDLTMEQAQDLIKATGHTLKLSVIKHGLKNAEQVGPTKSEMGTRVAEEEDPEFFDTLQDSVKGGTEDWSKREVKGGAFKKLQSTLESGR